MERTGMQEKAFFDCDNFFLLKGKNCYQGFILSNIIGWGFFPVHKVELC